MKIRDGNSIPSNDHENLKQLDDTIRDAISELNQLHPGNLAAIFLTTEEAKQARALLKEKAGEEQMRRTLKRVEGALRRCKFVTSDADGVLTGSRRK
jgi:hypothetical protein